MRDYEIFNERERRLLYYKKPELRPIKVPSLSDANTIRVPSLSEVVLLEQPSVDQIIIEFLKQYEVNVEPRSVGAWNGWDTLSTATSLFAREGSTLNIASTMFMANRSNQINSAAQDWGTWKRWALDHKNFDQYKDEVIQTINFHNENATKEVEEAIRQAEFHNKNAVEEIKKSIRKAELHNENLCKKLQDPQIKEYVLQLVENDNLAIANTTKKRAKMVKIIAISIFSIVVISLIGNFGYQIINNFSNRTKTLKATKYYLNLGLQKVEEGNDLEAIKNFKRVLNNDPNYYDAHFYLGRSYLSVDPQKAIMHSNIAINLRPKSARSYAVRSAANWELGNTESAFIAIDKAIQIKPKEGHYFVMRAFYKKYLGDIQGACEDAEKSIYLGGWQETEEFKKEQVCN